jgi:transitional endoplasmic reticulum ATPase
MNYDDPTLAALTEALNRAPFDLRLKRLLGLELQRNGYLVEALRLLEDVNKEDGGIEVERAIRDIREQIPRSDSSRAFGFQMPPLSGDKGKTDDKEAREVFNFTKVAGMKEIKEAIRADIIYPFQHPEIFKAYKKTAGGGILLYGPPGCGKTLLAKATAGEIDANFISVSIHEVLSGCIGDREQSIHALFERARRTAPSVLFFDEIDAIAFSRSSGYSPLRSVVNQLLTEMDGFGSENSNVLIIGATNLPWEVDSALRRPGRFDRSLFVPPPDTSARKRVFELELSGKPVEESVDFVKLAELSDRFSSADIAGICGDAADYAFREAISSGSLVKISQQILDKCLEKKRSSVLDWCYTAKNYVTYSNDSGIFDDIGNFLKSWNI